VVVEHALDASIPALEVDRLAVITPALLWSNGVQVRSSAHDYGGNTAPHPSTTQKHTIGAGMEALLAMGNRRGVQVRGLFGCTKDFQW